MNMLVKLLATSGSVVLISGCAGYGSMVNSFAPPKQKPAVVIGSSELAQKSSGKSELCAEPPAPKPVPANKEVYMVMPEEGGKVGTVVVTLNDGKEVMLHGDYSAMALEGDKGKAYVGDQEELQQTFGSAIAALPKAPMSATLYFLLGKDELTPASKAEADRIYRDFVERQAPEIWIIGHTDTVGSASRNEALSVRRAEKVRQSLIKLGVPSQNIKIMGRGERDLLVKTRDNTKEPKNRRVEINVR